MNAHDNVVRRLRPLRGEQPITSSSTVEDYLENWLWGKQSLRPSTHAGYETHVRRYLIPFLGKVRLSGLHSGQIQRMYQLLGDQEGRGGKALSVSSLRRVHATLMSALNTAVRRGLLDRNPAATVELPPVVKPRLTAWTEAELGQFLRHTQGDRLHLLFVLLGLVGLRRGEVVGLRWENVDLNQGTLRIEQSVVRVGKETVVGPPKSASGARTVAIDEETARRLHWHQCRQKMEVLRTTGVRTTPAHVFTTPSGDPLDPAYVSRRFDLLVAGSGLRRIRLHDLRHTSASIGLTSGESLLEVSRRLGHSSITVTADIYSHISPAVAKESAERLASSVYGARS
jgi:integrase